LENGKLVEYTLSLQSEQYCSFDYYGNRLLLNKESVVVKNNSEWWHDFFPAFRSIFGTVQPKTTNAEVRYLIKKLNLKPGKKFLDCPCGIGRIALPLARKGIRVTGVDIIPSYLDEVESKARRRGLKLDLHRAT